MGRDILGLVSVWFVCLHLWILGRAMRRGEKIARLWRGYQEHHCEDRLWSRLVLLWDVSPLLVGDSSFCRILLLLLLLLLLLPPFLLGEWEGGASPLGGESVIG